METNHTLLPGETVVKRFIIPEYTSVINSDIELAGETFTGNLNREDIGTTVSPAGTGGDTDTFIVDFHAFRTIRAVGLKNSSVGIHEAFMWLGTNFYTENAEGSIHPNLLDTSNVITTRRSYTYFTEVNTSKLKVILNASMTPEDFKTKFEVKGRCFPLNLRAKLGDEDPFWAAPGEFSKKASLPPLAETLNRLKPGDNNGENGIPLTLLSDAPGNVTLLVNKIGCHLEKIQLEGNETAKVQLKAGKPGKNTIDPISLTSPPIGEPGSQIRLEQIGFDLEGVILSDFGVKVSPVFTAAIKIELTGDLTVQGFKLLLGKDVSPDLELLAEIQSDSESRPCAENVLVSSPIEVEHTTLERDAWIEVNFEEAVELNAEKIYWLVLKSKTGTAQWKGYVKTNTGTGQAQPGQFKYSKNAGQTWQNHKVTGFFMLLTDPPQKDNLQLLPVTFKFDGEETETPPIYVNETAQTEKPAGLNKDITLDGEGKIDLKLRVTGSKDGFIQLSKAFVDYSLER